MADETVTTEPTTGTTEHVVKLITEPVKIDPATDDSGFDEQKYLSLHQRYAPQIEKTLGIDALKARLTASEQREAAKDMENAELKAQSAYGFTPEEITALKTDLPEATPAALLAAAKFASQYKAQAVESAKTIEAAHSRGILPSELGGGTAPDVPKEGTPEYGIYLIRKAQGLVK